MYSRVYVEITNICNMKCSFCHGHSRTPRQMTLAEFHRVLDQLQDQTQYMYYHLMGEPLSHPQLPDFVKLAGDSGFRSVITTNGTLLDKRGDALLAAGVHKVSISLHSFEAGADSVLEQYLEKTAAFAEKAGQVGTIVTFRLWNAGCDRGINEKIEAFLRHRLPGDWATNTRGYRIRDKLFLEWGDRFTWPDKEAPALGEQVFCYGLQDHFGILCDGTVVPCCMDSDGVIALGNLFREELKEILAGTRATAMVEGFACRTAKEDLCRRCGYARKF